MPGKKKPKQITNEQNNEDELNILPNDIDKVDKKERTDFPLSQALNLRLKHNLSYGNIGKQLNIPKDTVYWNLKKFEGLVDNPHLMNAYDDNRDLILNAAELAAVKELSNPEKLKSASYNNLAYGAKNLFEMRRTTKGEHIGIHEYHTVTAKLSEIDKEIEDLEREQAGN